VRDAHLHRAHLLSYCTQRLLVHRRSVVSVNQRRKRGRRVGMWATRSGAQQVKCVWACGRENVVSAVQRLQLHPGVTEPSVFTVDSTEGMTVRQVCLQPVGRGGSAGIGVVKERDSSYQASTIRVATRFAVLRARRALRTAGVRAGGGGGGGLYSAAWCAHLGGRTVRAGRWTHPSPTDYHTDDPQVDLDGQ
jgi:hypothetical protein